MPEIVKKCHLLTGYLEERIKRKYGDKTPPATTNNTSTGDSLSQNGGADGSVQSADNSEVHVEILTPSDLDQRGAQLSLSFSVSIIKVFEELRKRGVVVSYIISSL